MDQPEKSDNVYLVNEYFLQENENKKTQGNSEGGRKRGKDECGT